MEKFATWTNPKFKKDSDGGLTKKFPLTDLLDNVMIYWVTESIATSVRLYAENFSSRNFRAQFDALPVRVPSGCAKFRYELMYQSDALLKDRFAKLVQSTDYEDGGHFAAMELPQVLAKDLTDFVQKVEKE